MYKAITINDNEDFLRQVSYIYNIIFLDMMI